METILEKELTKNMKKLFIQLSERQDLINVLSTDRCAVFGAGRGCQYVLNESDKYIKNIVAIYVSNAENDPTSIKGIPVIEWDVLEIDKFDSIILALKEENQRDVLKTIEFGEKTKVYLLSNQLFYELGYEYETNRNLQLSDYMPVTNQYFEYMLRFVPHPCMDYMVLNILDHCNLRCKGCDHFACIAEPYLVSKESIHRDLDRMAEIMEGDYITKIGVMGGEPLLHPDLLEILVDVRTHFPYSIIRLTTNGILLGQQNELFWRTLREQDVSIVNTKYPLKIDHEALRKKAESENVKFMHFEGTEEGKKLFKKKINLEGTSNPAQSFARCHISNYGNFLMEGKLYGCPFSCQSYKIFNKRFNQNMRLTKSDYLDIYKITDKQEIFEFAARPKYYCRYCMGLSETFEWERTQQKIEEWI